MTSSTSNSKCLWKPFREQTSGELFDRLIELATIDSSDVIDKEVFEKEWGTLQQRFIENEELRRFVIDLRDNPHPITAESVIERLTNHTEDLKV